MRKLLFAIIAVAFVAMSANAQDNRHEISVGYGVGSANSIGNQFGVPLAGALIGAKTTDESFSGSINLEYMYRINRTIGVGAILNYEHSSYKMTFSDETISAKDNYYTVMPAVKFNWSHGEIARVYSKLAAGVCFDSYKCASQNDTEVDFAYQATALGVEVGRSICGFLELGYGYQGIAQIGVKYRF